MIKDRENNRLKSENNKWLTNKSEDFFTTEIWLGKEDSPDNYHEVSEEYKLAREAELETGLMGAE